MTNRVVGSITLNTFISVFSNAFLLEITNPATITTNDEFIDMAIHHPTTTKHCFNPQFLVPFFDLHYVVLEVF